jgi:hypothetical protein
MEKMWNLKIFKLIKKIFKKNQIFLDKLDTSFKYGDKCKQCLKPAYNNRNNGFCYLCDPGIWD